MNKTGNKRIVWNKGLTREIDKRISSHPSWNKGLHHSDESRLKMSKSRMGNIPWNKGIKMPPEVGKKIGEANKRRVWTEESRLKRHNYMKNYIASKETREKLSQSLKGHSVSDETRLKIAKSLNKGLYKENVDVLGLGWYVKSNGYGIEWNDKLKEKIKQRDGYRCMNPGCKGEDKRLSVHHINFNKIDCREENLITLCNVCNVKANKKRYLHMTFYQKMMEGIQCRIKWKVS